MWNVHLQGYISFLEHTSVLVDVFNDDKPISVMEDVRITRLLECKSFFQSWAASTDTS